MRSMGSRMTEQGQEGLQLREEPEAPCQRQRDIWTDRIGLGREPLPCQGESLATEVPTTSARLVAPQDTYSLNAVVLKGPLRTSCLDLCAKNSPNHKICSTDFY